jgi:hypothetical protein
VAKRKVLFSGARDLCGRCRASVCVIGNVYKNKKKYKSIAKKSTFRKKSRNKGLAPKIIKDIWHNETASQKSRNFEILEKKSKLGFSSKIIKDIWHNETVGYFSQQKIQIYAFRNTTRLLDRMTKLNLCIYCEGRPRSIARFQISARSSCVFSTYLFNPSAVPDYCTAACSCVPQHLTVPSSPSPSGPACIAP